MVPGGERVVKSCQVSGGDFSNWNVGGRGHTAARTMNFGRLGVESSVNVWEGRTKMFKLMASLYESFLLASWILKELTRGLARVSLKE